MKKTVLILAAALFAALSFSQGAVLQDSFLAAESPSETLQSEENFVFPSVDGWTESAVPERSATWAFVRMLVALACTAGAVFAILQVVKKSAAPKTSANPFLREVVSIPLGAGAQAHILAVANRAFLVGSGEKSVNLLAEIDDKDLIDAMVVYSSQKSDAERKDFGDFLATFIPALQKKESSKPQTPENILRQRRENFENEDKE